MQNVLITGASSGLGLSALNSLINLDHKIISLGRNPNSHIKYHPKIKHVRGDITAIDSLQKNLWGATSILHLLV